MLIRIRILIPLSIPIPIVVVIINTQNSVMYCDGVSDRNSNGNQKSTTNNRKLKVVLVVVVLIVVAIVFRYPNPGSLSEPNRMDAVSQNSWEQPSGETRWETGARARIWNK